MSPERVEQPVTELACDVEQFTLRTPDKVEQINGTLVCGAHPNIKTGKSSGTCHFFKRASPNSCDFLSRSAFPEAAHVPMSVGVSVTNLV